MKKRPSCYLLRLLVFSLLLTPTGQIAYGQNQTYHFQMDSLVSTTANGGTLVEYSIRPFDFGPINHPSPSKLKHLSFSEEEKIAHFEQFRTANEAGISAKMASYANAPSVTDYTLYSVGEIPIQEGVSPSGARTYQIPIATASGFKLSPSVALAYNSQGGDGWAGYGWNIQGPSFITIINKNKYYHGEAKGANVWNKDAVFALDGVPLVTNTQPETREDFPLVTTSGNILAAPTYNTYGYVSSFTVLYPNGIKAVFGYNSNSNQQKISYPVTEMTDMDGNKVSFSYSASNNDRLDAIRYGFNQSGRASGEIIFEYEPYASTCYVTKFYAGMSQAHNYRLSSIVSKNDNDIICRYDLSYEWISGNISLLKNVECSSEGKQLRPLTFEYGNPELNMHPIEGQLIQKSNPLILLKNFTEGETDLIYRRGKFVSGSYNDGLLIYPSFPNYGVVASYDPFFKRARYKLRSLYPEDQAIFFAPSLSDFNDVDDSIIAGSGFQTIETVDTDGDGLDEIVKVNYKDDGVNGDYTVLQISIYKCNSSGHPVLKSRFNVSIKGTYSDGEYLNPYYREYFWGDFLGNGKVQLLTVAFSTNGHKEKKISQTSYAALIDLSRQTKLCDAKLFDFPIDKYDCLITCDLDNDAQTELCYATPSGLDVYRFTSGTEFKKEKTLSGITESILSNKDRPYYITDLNGDGYVDIVRAPATNNSVYWTRYSFNGAAFASASNMSICRRLESDVFMFMDIDQDGLPDLLKISNNELAYYGNLNGVNFSTYRKSPSKISDSKGIVPANVVDFYSSSSFIKVDSFYVKEFIYTVPAPSQRQLTKSVDSFGRVLTNTYEFLPAHSRYWTDNSVTVINSEGYAFKTLPIYVLASENAYMNESSYANRIGSKYYNYFNAVIHNWGLGFCGFSKIRTYDYSGGISEIEEEIHEPQKRGVVISTKRYHGSVWSDALSTIDNTYDNNYTTYGKSNPRLIRSISKNNLTGVETTTSYSYGAFDLPTRIESKARINNGAYQTSIQENSYQNSLSSDRYVIGALTCQTVTTDLDGDLSSSWRTKTETEYDDNLRPLKKKEYAGSWHPDSGVGRDSTKIISETRWSYDSHGNVLSEKTALYGATEFIGSTYTYDAEGRYLRTKTNALGQTTTYSGYDKFGNPSSSTDYRGRVTNFFYNEWGDLVTTTLADGSKEENIVSWGGRGLYTTSTIITGRPEKITHYDALGRVIRSGVKRFDGQWLFSDKEYDSKGRLLRTSLPYRGEQASYWNTYGYDEYDRPTFISEASGRVSTWTYYGTCITTSKDGIVSTSTSDASGNVISVTDEGGTINYTLRDDGQPSVVTAPGNVETSFLYDGYGRRISIIDPSAGTRTENYTNNTDGSSVVTSTNPNGIIITRSDKYGRITKIERPGEYDTEYLYDTYGRISSEQSTNGTSTLYTYDNLDRICSVKETVPDGMWLKKDYSYGPGSVLASTQYSSQSGVITTETYTYANGHNTGIHLPDGTTVWSLVEENDLGLPTEITSGNINRKYGYSEFGLPTFRKMDDGYLQDFRYQFDPQTGNLLVRQDMLNEQDETFGYDQLNRLTSAGDRRFEYDIFGNIISSDGVGTMTYGNVSRPYQVTSLSPEGEEIGREILRDQTISYTCYNRPSRINEGGRSASFTYNGSGERVKMFIGEENKNAPSYALSTLLLKKILDRYYIGGVYERDVTYKEEAGMPFPDKTSLGKYSPPIDVPDEVTERLYLGGDAYSAPMVLIRKNDGPWALYNIGRDYLGSITHIATADGSIVAEYSYDPWGRLRDPQTLEIYVGGSEPELFLGRGYTGHEHLTWFGLINMNARLYDPLLGRFLSPDPYVQAPNNTQNFNRYSYALNNPLRYTDESGEFLISTMLIVGGITAAIFGAGNVAAHAIRGEKLGHGKWAKYFFSGAAAGFVVGSAWYAAGAGIAALSKVGGILGKTAVITKNVALGVQAVHVASSVSSLIGGAIKNGWKGIGNAAKIFLGSFYLDENASFGKSILQGISRHTWETFQTEFGYDYSQFRNAFGSSSDRVDFLGGATFVTNENSRHEQGITIGPYCNMDIHGKIDSESFVDYVTTHPLYMHEYGHLIDSRCKGFAYLFNVGLPSLMSAKHADPISYDPYLTTHDIKPYEMRANRNSATYFGQYYGVDWSIFEDEYPRHY